MSESEMALITVKDKFQVTIPARLRERIGLRIGDLMEATVHKDGILLRPKAVVDRAVVAEQLERVLRTAAVAPGNQGKSEQLIIDEAIADVAAVRRRRRK
jgi:AbrB family looped-hinge helix DNA binding protein